MSTAERVLIPGQRPPGRYERGKSRSASVMGRATGLVRRVPGADWITLLLLGVMLATVGWSVQLAKWGDLPSIIPTLLMGWGAAFLASRSKAPVAVKLVLAVLIGFAIIMWQGSIPAEGSNIVARTHNAWDRFWEWIDIARAGGISTDSVPFALMFMTASWITGYTVTALTFRFRNPWPPVVLLSVGLLNNLSFRPGLYEYTFFIFTVASVALFAHLTAVRRTDRWNALGMTPPTALHWLSVRDGLLLGTLVVAIAAVLPLWEPRSGSLDHTWDTLKSPIVALQDPASRLLAGVKAQPGDEGLFVPTDVAAFQGPIHLTPEPLMWVTSRYERMLPGKVYEQYTSAGWIADPQITVNAGPRDDLLPPPDDAEREWSEQLVQPLVETRLVLPAGAVYSVDQDAKAEYLAPSTFTVQLTGPIGALASLPADVRDYAFTLRFALKDIAPRGRAGADTSLNQQAMVSIDRAQDLLDDTLPSDMSATIVPDGSGELAQSVVLQRKGPMEQVGVTLDQEADVDSLYRVNTYVSVATDDELAAAGTDYPGWVKDRYLQLPDTLPAQVRELANQIVRSANARTPYEKIRAIQAFLRSQVYSQEIHGPAANVDGIYYMLFQTQNEPCPSVNPGCDVSKIKAYSQYYGSAGAVLLRAVGVPTRMIVGWAAGEYVPNVGKFLVRDEDRHGWMQAYFPDYGWIDIEMTPGKAETDRGVLFPVEPARGEGGPAAVSSASEENPDLSALDEEEVNRLQQEALAALAQQRAAEEAADGWSFPWTPVIVASSIAGAALLIYAGWVLLYRGMAPGQKAYTKVVRAGWLFGVSRKPWQTPAEFAATVAAAAPGAADSAEAIAEQYERERYSHNGKDGGAPGLDRHWRRVFFGLLGHRLRTLTGSQPEMHERRSTA